MLVLAIAMSEHTIMIDFGIVPIQLALVDDLMLNPTLVAMIDSDRHDLLSEIPVSALSRELL